MGNLLVTLRIKIGPFKSISSSSQCFTAFHGILLSITLVIVGLEVSVGTGLETKASVKTLPKGDRLQSVNSFHPDPVVTQPRSISLPARLTIDLKLADGCEALVSALAPSALKYIAGRCLS
jgi:hypothetical protein